MTSPPPGPAYTETGLDDWLRAVPLTIPCPPSSPSTWTCLFQLLGARACFARDGSRHHVSDDALRGLLEAAGRPTFANESRPLLLVTPIGGGVDPDDPDDPLELLCRLVRRAAMTPRGPDVLTLLQFRHDVVQRLRGMLVQLAGSSHPLALRRAAIDALGVGRWSRESEEWTEVVSALARWDGELDAERLCAMVRLGALPDELPMGELAELHGWIPDLDRDAGRGLVGRYDTLPPALQRVLREVLAVVPGAAGSVVAELAGVLAQIPDELGWLPVFAAAGSSVEDILVDALDTEGTDPLGWKTRMGAAMALGVLEELGDRAHARLRTARGDDDSDVRRESALALRRHGIDTPLDAWTDAYGFAQRVGARHPWGAAFVGGPVPLDLVALLARREGGLLLSEAALVFAFAHPEPSGPVLEALAADRGFDVPLPARVMAAAGVLATGKPPQNPALHALLLGAVGTGSSGGDGAAFRRATTSSADQPVRDETNGAPPLPESLATLAARDGDWQVRLQALALLGHLGAAPRFDALLSVLEVGDPDADVRALAARLRAPRFRDETIATLLGDLVAAPRHDTAARVRALHGILEREEALAERLATVFFATDDRELAVLSGRILGGLATARSAADRLSTGTRALRHPSWIRREAAGALLGALDPTLVDEAMLEELVETLDARSTTDDDTDVQRMAKSAADALRRRRT